MHYGNAIYLSFIVAVLAWSALANTRRCRNACTRSGMVLNYGFDVKLRPLTIDLGMCIAAEPLTDCGYGVPDGDEYPEFSNDSSCDQACVPGEYVLKPYSNRTGAFMASIVTSCRTYNPECGACRLTPLWVTAFPGSSFKSAVNVGACEGTCPETANACIAKNTKTVAVSGPNGVITVEQTLECGCEDKKCHREDYYESYWEVVEGIDRNGTVVKEKLINVGRCRGDCNGILTPKICFP
ncbi:hypothetical protein EMCRGX_G022746 [Ephydatia muelleri]